MMPEGRSAAIPAQGLCEVTVLVPKDCVERIRQFAQELRARPPAEPLPTRLEWQTVSPSAELVVTRDCSARCVVRDTRAAGVDRFLWTVVVLGKLDPVAEGRAKDRAEARLQAEAAVAAYFAGWVPAVGRWECAMTDGPLRHLFWRVADELDYLLTLARLRILDALAGPEPETPADQRRERKRMESWR